MDDQETERQHEIVPRKISFLDCAEDQISSGAKTGVIAVIENELNEKQNDIHLSISNDPLKNDFTLFKIYKNLFVLSISFVLMFTAYNGAALVGLAAAPLWTAKATYLNKLAQYHAQHHKQAEEISVSLFFGIFFAFFDQIRLSKKQPLKQSLKKSLEVIISLTKWQHIDQLFLIPVTMWSTIETAFLTAQFTRGFVTCLAGIRYVGLIMVCAGVSQAISSYVFGRLVKYTSRLFCLIVAFVLNYGTIILMFLWKANPDQLFLLFIIAGIWNVADAIWQTQVIATYTVLYAESDPTVLAKYRLWKSVGFVVTYGFDMLLDLGN
ncbi:unnamed protein product [Didymodactylos carnosus]|uniref:UNC93-like protein n=1 Tax=Didymodactylos carnosus TaxID=1234261 RepID=A0A815FLD1_9BILA|nr:unnamed protein product [Didymodactylos carnosus]CAF1446959.1 unnamed protein product [Didymodactylos carnosus]CAF4165679.1 unnamed protein product [Didymodactylos carnosus]CAF4242289.1 unnamed protein product [Didymodactylos carnosus]